MHALRTYFLLRTALRHQRPSGRGCSSRREWQRAEWRAMVKAYLRYELAGSWGVITSPASNCVFDRSGRHLLTGALENVAVWNLKQAALVRPDCASDWPSAPPPLPPPPPPAATRDSPPAAAAWAAGQDAQPTHLAVGQGGRGGHADRALARRQPDRCGPRRRRGEAAPVAAAACSTSSPCLACSLRPGRAVCC